MKKTFRDIRETVGSFISILIIIFIGCFFFAGITDGMTAITAQVNDYYDECLLADARAEYMYVNSAAVDKIAESEGVDAVAGYDTFHTRVYLGGTTSIESRFDATITTLTQGIDEPWILDDGMLPREGMYEIILDKVFCDEHGIKLGDTVRIEFNVLSKITVGMNPTPQYTPEYELESRNFTVCGIYHSPDVIYKVNILNTAAQPAEFAMGYINYGAVKSYKSDTNVYFEGMPFPIFSYKNVPDGINLYTGIKARGNADFEKLFAEYSVADENTLGEIFHDPSMPAGMYMYTLERKNFPSVAAFTGINDTLSAIAAVLPWLFFGVAAAITVISLSKTVESQRMQIGIMQALGVSKGNVYFSYIFYALFASVIGAFLGGLVGMFTVPVLLDVIYAFQFSMPPTTAHMSGLFLLLGVLISAALASLSAFISCFRTLRAVPAQAMRQKPPKNTKRILVERWKWLWSRLGFGAKMNLRNMFLHKMKIFLSSVGIIGCLALLLALIGLKDNMAFSFKSYDAASDYDLTIVTDIAIDIDNEEVYEHIADAAGEEYMHNLTFVPDFSGRFEFDGKTSDLTVMALPTYADEKKYKYADADCVKLYTDLGGKNRLLFESDTFVIPEMLAKKLGCKAGDTVKVSGYSLDNRSVEFEITVTAVVCEYFEQKAYCSYDVFVNNDVGLYADTSYATFLPGADREAAIAALKSYDAVRGVKTFRESYEALEKQMSLLDIVVVIFVVGAAALAIAVIYNITATNLKERTREIATLMVLGYKRNETANMVIVENMVITAIGCVVGLPLGYGLLYWLCTITASFNVFISSFFSWYVAIGCMLLTFVFSLIATMLLNTRLKKISMVEALKSVE